MKILFSGLAFLFLFFSLHSVAQEKILPVAEKDSAIIPVKKNAVNKYDSAFQAHSPRKAAIRSAILPGWGQIYNKKYWKLPLVYAALGITTYIFIDNIKTYKEYRFAYTARVRASSPTFDSTDYKTLKYIYTVISPSSIQSARNKFRQYVDYSALFFILFWGLNVVDATVDAHLKSFDISPDLSFHIKAGYSNLAKTNGLSLVLKMGK